MVITPLENLSTFNLKELIPWWIRWTCNIGFVPATINDKSVRFKILSFKMFAFIFWVIFGFGIEYMSVYSVKLFDPEETEQTMNITATFQLENWNFTDIFSVGVFSTSILIGCCLPCLLAYNFASTPMDVLRENFTNSNWPKYGNYLASCIPLELIAKFLARTLLKTPDFGNTKNYIFKIFMFYSCELVGAVVQLSLYVTHSLLFFWLLEKYAKYFKFQYKNHKLCLQYFQDLKVKFGSYLFVEYGSLQVYAIVSSFQVVSPFLSFADHVPMKWILTSAGYFSTVMGLIILLIGTNDMRQEQTIKY